MESTLPKKNTVTWILVADGKHAQIYVPTRGEKRIPLSEGTRRRHYNESTVRELVPVPGMSWHAEPLEKYEVEIKTGIRTGEPKIDARKETKQHFAIRIAEEINAGKSQKLFDRLVLVAPPKMLGELRDHLSKDVLASVTGELHKDLTHYENAELKRHIGTFS